MSESVLHLPDKTQHHFRHHTCANEATISQVIIIHIIISIKSQDSASMIPLVPFATGK
jgi:hypothetical protein